MLLIKIEGTFKQERYKEILDSEFVPLLTKQYGNRDSVVFQRDYCGSHKAESVSTFYIKKGIEVMCWRAQSPDLDPIENSWAYLKRRL